MANTVVTVKRTKSINASLYKTGIANVLVGRKRTVQVSSNTNSIIDSTSPVTLVRTPTVVSIGGAENLEDLKNVQVSSKIEGATLVYDANTNYYVVKHLSVDYIDGGIHGGTF